MIDNEFYVAEDGRLYYSLSTYAILHPIDGVCELSYSGHSVIIHASIHLMVSGNVTQLNLN